MVSFVCESCQDTIKKPKLKTHAQWCHGPFTCIDCNTTFQGRAWESHTSCITEEQKYQKGDLKGKGQKKGLPSQKEAQRTSTVLAESKPVEQRDDVQKAAGQDAKSATEAVNGEKESEKKENKDKKGKEKKEKKGRKEEEAQVEKTEEPKKEKKSKKEDKEKKEKKRKHSPEVDNALSHAPAEALTNGVTELNGKKNDRKRKVSPEVDNSLSHASAEVVDIKSEKKKDKKDKKRKVSDVDTKDADTDAKPKKKKSKKEMENNETPTEEDLPDIVMPERGPSPPPDPDLPMPDITTLLLPDIVPLPLTPHGIHPSRAQLFSTPAATSTLENIDPSFRPRPQDIQRARRALERRLNPSKPTKAKLTLQEKQANRKAKKLKRLEEPKPFVHKPVEITREPIEDPLKYFVEDLVTGEAQKLGDLVKKCKVDVRSGGGVLNISRGLFTRLGLRKEGVSEDGSGGVIFVDVLERKVKTEDADKSDDDDDNSGSD